MSSGVRFAGAGGGAFAGGFAGAFAGAFSGGRTSVFFGGAGAGFLSSFFQNLKGIPPRRSGGRVIRFAAQKADAEEKPESITRAPGGATSQLLTSPRGLAESPASTSPDFLRDFPRSSRRVLGLVDRTTDNDRVGARGDCIRRRSSLRSDSGREDELRADDSTERPDPGRPRGGRDDASSPGAHRNPRHLLGVRRGERRAAGMAHLRNHEDLRSARGFDGRANGVLADEPLRDDPGRTCLRDLIDDEAGRVRNLGGPQVCQQISELCEVAKYVPPAGEEESPPDLDCIDLPADRSGDRDRRSRVDEVEREDQSPVEAHRGPEEGDGEKDSLNAAIPQGAPSGARP